MKADYIDVVKQRVESQCPICSNKLLISFAITMFVLSMYGWNTFTGVFAALEGVYPITVFVIAYIAVGALGTSTIPEKKYKDALAVVKHDQRKYINDVNSEVFDNMIKAKEAKKSPPPPKPRTGLPPLAILPMDLIRSPVKIAKFRFKEDKETFLSEHLENKHATAKIKSGDIGCMLDPNVCISLCSGVSNPGKLVAPIPGPQWQPQTAKSVHIRMKNKDYTQNYCPLRV